MPVFLITGYDGQDAVFYRETPHMNGVGPLLNEAISMLSGNPNSSIIVESLYEDSPEPQMEKFIPYSDYDDFYVDEWDAESKKKSGRVITMSGKPHKPRKLKQDDGISPEEAIQRISFRADSAGWVIDDITVYDDAYGSKADGTLYNPESNERIEFENADVSMDYYIPPMDNIYVDYDDEEDDEDEDLDSVVEQSMMEAEGFYDDDGVGPKHMASESANPTGGNTGDQIVSWEHNGLSSPSGPPSDIFWAEGKKNCGCGQDPCKTYGAESKEFRSSLDESFDEIL